MISIKQPTEPYNIEVIKGVTFTVKPLTTFQYTLATVSAQQRVNEIEKSIEDVAMAGLSTDGSFDPKNPQQRNALYMELLIKELAIAHITDWDGVSNENGDAPAECTFENICAVMEQSAIAESFFQLFTNYVFLLQEAKKRIRTLAAWHFKKNGGPSYCESCKDQELPCVFENLCPYKVNAPRLLQEQQAWEIIEDCITQLNISPAGKIMGLQMDVALDLVKARNFDLEIVSQLLIEAERGILEAVEENQE